MMITFTINNENEIVAFSTKEEAAASATTPFDSFSSQQELADLAASWPAARLIEIWNTFSGVTPVSKFRDHKTGLNRIWTRIQRLGESAKGQPIPALPTKTQRNAKSRAHAAKSSSAGKTGKSASPAKSVSKGKRAARGATGPREGSKTAQVVAMLQRKGGATLTEIMEKMDWQRHTVRGFMAGVMKKAGYTVTSFKPEGGERTYRISQ
jgi:Protein of unknown function (DUF3489)